MVIKFGTIIFLLIPPSIISVFFSTIGIGSTFFTDPPIAPLISGTLLFLGYISISLSTIYSVLGISLGLACFSGSLIFISFGFGISIFFNLIVSSIGIEVRSTKVSL